MNRPKPELPRKPKIIPPLKLTSGTKADYPLHSRDVPDDVASPCKSSNGPTLNPTWIFMPEREQMTDTNGGNMKAHLEQIIAAGPVLAPKTAKKPPRSSLSHMNREVCARDEPRNDEKGWSLPKDINFLQEVKSKCLQIQVEKIPPQMQPQNWVSVGHTLVLYLKLKIFCIHITY